MRKSETPPRRSRLGGSPDSLPVAPFHKAEDFKRCEMCWLSSSLPSTVQQRAWTLRFLADLVKRVSPQGELQPQLFVDADAIFPERQEQFVQTALDFNPIMGFSRTPGADMPSVPKTELVESIRRQEKPFTVQPFLQGICYWFLKKDFQKQLDLFWGYGGMTMLLVKPDPASQPPAVVIPAGVKKHPAYQSMSRQHDTQGLLDTAYSIQSGFLQKSKEHFGKGWETKVEYRGLLYVLPRWTSRDFFALPEEDIEHLFEICDLYLTESPVDKGVLLVSRKPIRAVLHEVIGKLQDDGVMFSEPR